VGVAQSIILRQTRRRGRFYARVSHTAIGMTRALDGIAADGFGDAVSPKGIATLSLYQTEHINRFGDYVLDMSMSPGPLPFTLPQRR
jgi:hypothetical protein